MDIHELRDIAEDITGKPAPYKHGAKVVAKIMYRDGTVLDEIYCTEK